jgi:hypothetical protein
MKMAWLCAALTISTAAMAGAPQDYSGMPPDLAARAKAFDDAQLHADGKALADILADDYTLVNGGAAVSGKAQFIKDYTDPDFKMMPFMITEQVEKIWRDGAVLGGRVVMRFTDHTKPGQSEFRFGDIWAKRGGKWQVIYTQVTRLPKS